jgi:hypothetical protein
MLYPYRVLKQDIVKNKLEVTYFTSLPNAHKACLPDSNSVCHLMLNGVEDKLHERVDLIRVTCYTDRVYWIENLIGRIEPVDLPYLPSKIECCHPVE